MATKPTTIDQFLAALSKDKQVALQKLRQAIQAAAPQAEECISYGVPAFRLHGKVLLCFGAGADHCALYTSSGTTVSELQEQLKKYDTSKGTIRFAANKPLPATLVRKLVKIRMDKLAGAAKPKRSQADSAVPQFMVDLHHPLKKEIEAVRKIILSVSPKVREAIKWNAPSFRTSEFFATFNLRSKKSVQLIFHLGAKVRDITIEDRIPDPTGLLKWLAKDRAMVDLGIKIKKQELVKLIREWLKWVE